MRAQSQYVGISIHKGEDSVTTGRCCMTAGQNGKGQPTPAMGGGWGAVSITEHVGWG